MFYLLHTACPNDLKGHSVPFDCELSRKYQVFSSLDSVWRVIIAPYN